MPSQISSSYYEFAPSPSNHSARRRGLELVALDPGSIAARLYLEIFPDTNAPLLVFKLIISTCSFAIEPFRAPPWAVRWSMQNRMNLLVITVATGRDEGRRGFPLTPRFWSSEPDGGPGFISLPNLPNLKFKKDSTREKMHMRHA